MRRLIALLALAGFALLFVLTGTTTTFVFVLIAYISTGPEKGGYLVPPPPQSPWSKGGTKKYFYLNIKMRCDLMVKIDFLIAYLKKMKNLITNKPNNIKIVGFRNLHPVAQQAVSARHRN